ncbi:hypothetical protein SF83666_c05080 [Sinorhizobium fredii CCBAU 83666]|nr:hypothetical protein SF83666_c05080 [Sinorhizobium fredii CCBAU 83666]
MEAWINSLVRGFSVDCPPTRKMPAISLTNEKPCRLGFC